ncbi:MAG: hydroxylamine reductase, partial [Bacteroidales bacterium]|nr:hydroxylamine reductase [Bacteroidales bacterium]
MSNMFCYQCQETAKNSGCTIKGVCGKSADVANLQDLLVYLCKGISHFSVRLREMGIESAEVNKFVTDSLFMTITNANFDRERFVTRVNQAIDLRDSVRDLFISKGGKIDEITFEGAYWSSRDVSVMEQKATEVGVLSTENEDVRSLRELTIYGLKGVAAYAEHAFNLGHEQADIYSFMQKALVDTTDDSLSADQLTALVLETGALGVKVMALLDKANTSAYGNPEITKVNLGVRNNPA